MSLKKYEQSYKNYMITQETRLKSLLNDNPGYIICPVCEGTGRVIERNYSYTLKCPLCEGKYIIDWVTNIMNKSDYKKNFRPF